MLEGARIGILKGNVVPKNTGRGLNGVEGKVQTNLAYHVSGNAQPNKLEGFSPMRPGLGPDWSRTRTWPDPDPDSDTDRTRTRTWTLLPSEVAQ